MKSVVPLLALILLLAVAPRGAWAQSGCINSPENPTVVLAAVGSAGALVVSLRRRSRW